MIQKQSNETYTIGCIIYCIPVSLFYIDIYKICIGNSKLIILIRFEFNFGIFIIANLKKSEMLLRRLDCRSGVRQASKI